MGKGAADKGEKGRVVEVQVDLKEREKRARISALFLSCGASERVGNLKPAKVTRNLLTGLLFTRKAGMPSAIAAPRFFSSACLSRQKLDRHVAPSR